MENIFNKIRLSIILIGFVLVSCEDLIYKDQPLVLLEDQNFKDWVDYRSAELGLYALQQELVEQLIVLGELRGDLVKTSSDADPDLIDIQNFNVSSGNAYASANNFYKLVSACNALIRTLELNHPEVLESNPQVSDYQRIYGEALCMKSWTYFNAVRIYGEIPYIPEQLTNYEDVIDYMMNPGAEFYIDSGRYMYDINGLDIVDLNDTVYYPMDTVYLDTIHFETYAKRFVDMQTIVDMATYDLTERLNFVGVEYGKKDEIDQEAWEVIIWTDYSKDYLLGQMALTMQNPNDALAYFDPILHNYTDSRFKLTSSPAFGSWKSIFTGINIDEHIFTAWFGKSTSQTHQLQSLFDNSGTNLFYLRPTTKAIDLWETEWSGQNPTPSNLWNTSTKTVKELTDPGVAGDFYRGHKASYVYKRNDVELTNDEVSQMLAYKQNQQNIDVQNIMRDVDTLVYKYTIDKSVYDNDSHVSLYRAASVHLYASEICLYSQYYDNGAKTYRISQAPFYLDGTYDRDPDQLGVRGRVGLYQKAIDLPAIVLQDPYTNEITGYREFAAESGGDSELELYLKQYYYEGVILDERGKELAFEGERFYDIMRFAKRHNDPSFLANTIADAKGKYSAEEREEVREKLMNESNWYIPFFINMAE